VAGEPERGAPGVFLGGAHEQYFAGVGIAIAISIGVWSVQEKAQEKTSGKRGVAATTTPPAASPAAASPAPVKKENPVKSSPEVLAAAKKVFWI